MVHATPNGNSQYGNFAFHLHKPSTNRFLHVNGKQPLSCSATSSATSSILVPRGRAPFGQHQESRPLALSNDIPFLNGFVNTIDWDQNQSDLSNLTLNMRRVTGSPWIADFRCWTWPEVAILDADQKERGLWGRECHVLLKIVSINFISV